MCVCEKKKKLDVMPLHVEEQVREVNKLREKRKREREICNCLCAPFYRLHEFVWHGTDPLNKTRKVPGALKFTKLRVIPDQFYYNVDDVSVLQYM